MNIKSNIIFIFLLFTINIHSQHYFNTEVLSHDPPDFSHLYDLKHGDIDNDGDDDLVAYSRVNGLIWLRNDNGRLVYHKSSILSSGSSGFDVELSDLDNDGDLDVVINRGWYENSDGRGTFRSGGVFPSVDDRGDIACADFDGDGDDDIVIISDDDIYIFYNQNAVFEKELIYEDLINIEFLEVLDINKDGRLDFITYVGIATSHFTMFYNEVDGFRPHNGGGGNPGNGEFGLNSVSLGDINGDGITDFCTGSAINSEITVRLGKINGGFGPDKVLVSGVEPLDIHLADFNGDIYDDIYARNGILIYNPDTESYDITGFQSGANGQLLSAYAYDINGDGLDDLIRGGDDQVSVSYTISNSTFASSEDVIKRLPIEIGQTSLFDFDGDQDLDIVFNLGWMPYDHSTDQYLAYEKFNGGGGSLFDFNLDGKMDLVSVGSGGISVFLATSVIGEFELFGSVSASSTRSGDFADIDGDGDIDIVIRRDSHYEWFRNEDGQGTFSEAMDITGDIFTGDFKLGDYDNDGDIDIIGAMPQTGKIALYENTDGLGSFSSPQKISESRFQSLKLIDIDENGYLDIIFMNNFPISISLLKNTSSGLLPSISVGFPGTDELVSMKFRDYDLDGDLDYIANTKDNKIYFVESIDFASTFIFPMELIANGGDGNKNSFDVGDLDGDGDFDVISRGESSRELLLHRATADSTNTINFSLNTNIGNAECNKNSSNKSFLFKSTNDSGKEYFTFLGADTKSLITTSQGFITTEIHQKLPEYYDLFQDKANTQFCGVGNTNSLKFCLSPLRVAIDYGASIYPLPNESLDTLDLLIAIEDNSTNSSRAELSFMYPENVYEILESELPFTNTGGGEALIQLEDNSPLNVQTYSMRLVSKTPGETLPDFNLFGVNITNEEDIIETNDSTSILIPSENEANLVTSTKGNTIKWNNRELPINLILTYPVLENDDDNLLLKYHWPAEMDLSTINILYSDDSLSLAFEDNVLILTPSKRTQSMSSNDNLRSIILSANLVSDIKEAALVNNFVELIKDDVVSSSMNYPIEIGKQCPEGEILITSQADILALESDWPDCIQVKDMLRVRSQEQLDLSLIQNIKYIEGNVIIEESIHQPTLESFLTNIDTIMGDLSFISTAQEGHLELSNTYVGAFRVDECHMLDSISFSGGNIASSNSSDPGLYITNNNALTTLIVDPRNRNDLNGQNIKVSKNSLLNSADLLFRNDKMIGNIEITDNTLLKKFSGFGFLDSLEGSIQIERNELLEEVSRFWNVKNVSGSINFQLTNPIDTLSVFVRLRSIGEDLVIKYPKTEILRSLESLRNVGANANISLSEGLISHTGLGNLKEVGGSLRWTNENYSTTSTEAFELLEHVNGSFFLNKADSLSFTNLSNLLFVGDTLSITNSTIKTLSPLLQLDFNSLKHVELTSNPFLTECNTSNFCEFLIENDITTVNISFNEEGCSTAEQVMSLCLVSTFDNQINFHKIIKNSIVDQYIYFEDLAIDSEVEILSFNGKVILKTEHATQLDCSHLPKGMYFVKAKKGKMIAVEKFIKH